MNFDHTSLPSFEPILLDLHHYAFHAGIDALQERGLLRADSELPYVLRNNPSAVRRFFRGCHYGFDLAQRKVGKLVIEYEKRAKDYRAKLKQARRDRNNFEIKAIADVLDCLSRRQLILRRLIDSILWQMVSQEPWLLRRTQVSDSISPIDPVVLEKTLVTAGQLNRENRKCIHIVSDITTAVQIGDLVRLCVDSNPRRWEIIELKEGKVNDALLGLIGQSAVSPENLNLDKIEESFGQKSVSQVRRMLRQKGREEAIENFRTTDKGIDPQTKEIVELSPESVEVVDYFDRLKRSCSVAKQSGASAFVVDGCLRVMVVSDSFYSIQGRNGIAHNFYHWRYKGATCKLPVAGERESEIEAIGKIWPFFDLVEANLRAQWPAPLFMWPMPKALIFDFALGRLRAFAQLDFEQFFSLAAMHGMELRWLSQKETKSVVSRSQVIPGSPHSRGVLAKMPCVSKHGSMQLMIGSFARLFLELMTPRHLLKMTEGSLRRLDHQAQSQEESGT
jgi:hypothetical protein